MKLIFLDCETTGTDEAKHGLVQIAGEIVLDEQFSGVPFDYRAQPFPRDIIDEEALEINGLKLEQLEQFSPPKNMYLNLIALLNSHVSRYSRRDKLHFIGYNADFDAKFIRRFFEKNDNKYFGSYFWWPIIDVSKLAGHRLMNYRHQLRDFKLKTVAAYLGIPIDPARLHDAAYDIWITKEIYRIVTQDVPAFPDRNP